MHLCLTAVTSMNLDSNLLYGMMIENVVVCAGAVVSELIIAFC